LYFAAEDLDRSLDHLRDPLLSLAPAREAGGISPASVLQSMGQAAACGSSTRAPGVSAAPQKCLVLSLPPHGIAGSLAWKEKGTSFFRLAGD